MDANVSQHGAEQLQADLVFEGGGVKGIGLAGAYHTLSDRGYHAECVAGTSAGAITAALVAAGYTGAELEDIVLHQMDFRKFEDNTFLNHFGIAGDLVQFLHSRGMHSGNYFLGWITELLQHKKTITFGDLRDEHETDPKRLYKLRVVASDISARRMLVLPQDADHVGKDPDELTIAEAVRMSMSIPFFFEPVRCNGHDIVDGGLLSNYPIWLFDCSENTEPRFPTFGMLLVAPDQTAPLLPSSAEGTNTHRIGSDIDFVKAIAETMMEAHDRFYVEQANYARTIPIPTTGVRTTEFDISPQRAADLFKSGSDAAAKFLATWSFDEYKKTFRAGKAPTRRETVSRKATKTATA